MAKKDKQGDVKAVDAAQEKQGDVKAVDAAQEKQSVKVEDTVKEKKSVKVEDAAKEKKSDAKADPADVVAQPTVEQEVEEDTEIATDKTADKDESIDAKAPVRPTGLLVAIGLVVALVLILIFVFTMRNKADVDAEVVDAAATVNGAVIPEEKITSDVASFRRTSNLEDDAAWVQWLNDYGYTPQTIRKELIDFYIEQELMIQAAAQEGIVVDPSEIDMVVANEKSNYDSEEAWQAALSAKGQSEDGYRKAVETSLASQALQEKVIANTTATDEQIIEFFQENRASFDGAKRTSHILFALDDESTANAVLEQLANSEISFEDAAREYSIDEASAANGGDVGWGTTSPYPNAYQQELQFLEVGQVSSLVQTSYGYHIIKCTEHFVAPAEITGIDQIPEEFVNYIRTNIDSTNDEQSFYAWFDAFKESATIVINDMPEGLPYDIDLTTAPTPSEAGGEGGENGAAPEVGQAAEQDVSTLE